MFKPKSNFTELKRLKNFYTDGKIQLTSDGQLALCCQHHTINLLNLHTGAIEFAFSHEDKSKLSCFHLTADDKYLFTANSQFLIRQWNFKDRSIVKSWRSDHKAPVACMDSLLASAGLDERGLLCTGSSDASARVFEHESKNVVNIFKKHSGVVSLVKFHPLQPQQLITSCTSYAIKIWNLSTSKCLRVLDGHFSVVTSIVFSTREQLLYSASRDKVVMIWKLNDYSSRTIALFESIEGMLLMEGGGQDLEGVVEENLQDDHLVVVGDKGQLSVWNAVKSVKVFPKGDKGGGGNGGGVAMETDCLLQCLRRKDGCLVTVTAEQVISLHHPSDFSILKQFSGNNDQILDIKFLKAVTSDCSHTDHHSHTEHLVVATNSHKVRLYSTADWSCSLYGGHTDVIVALETMTHVDGTSYVATASKDNTMRLWKVNSAAPKLTLTCVAVAQGHLHTVSCVAFIKIATKSDSSQLFMASGSNDKSIRIWKYTDHHHNAGGKEDEEEDEGAGSLKVKLVVEGHSDDINHLAVSPDSKLIASASRDKTAKLWMRADLKPLGTFKGHKRGVWSVEFSPVNKVVATSSADTTIKLWDMASFACIKSLEQHQTSVLKGFFMSGDSQFVSGDSSGCLRLWDVKSKSCERVLDCHDDRMWALALSPCQHSMVSGDAEGVVVYWSLVTKEEEDREEAAKLKELKLKEQELENLMQAGKHTSALSLSISLQQPRRSLHIVKLLWERKDGTLEKTLSVLTPSLIRSLLEYTVLWNRDHRNYVVCESIHYHYLRTLSQEDFMAFDNGQHLLDNLFLNSRKIFNKWKQLNVESTFILFLLRSMNFHSTVVPELPNAKTKNEPMEADGDYDSSDDSD